MSQNDTSKKICMFANGHVLQGATGGARRFIELYRAFTHEGYHVSLYSNDTQEDSAAHGIADWHPIVIRKSLVNIPGINVLFNSKALFDKIKDEKYQWIIVFDVMSAITPCFYHADHVALFFRQDMIGYRRQTYADRNMNPIKMNILLSLEQMAERICIKRSELLVSQCQYDINQLLSRHSSLKNIINSKMVKQINNINPSWVHPADSAAIEKNYDLVLIGNFKDSRKGHFLLLEALDQLDQKGIHYKTVILGDGKQLESCKQKYSHLKNITFVGYQKDTIRFIQSARLMIVPSYADSCPNTVLESLYYGTPVIGSDISGIPEILNNPEWLFPLSASGIADALQHYLENQDTLDNLALQQRSRASELTFDWGHQVIRILNTQ